MSKNLVDNVISFFNPRAGAEREMYRTVGSAFTRHATGFIAPGISTRKSVQNWATENRDADTDMLVASDYVRAASRDLTMNTPIAGAIINRKVANIIGGGLTVQSRVNREFLGLSDKKADAWERNAEREFDLWASSKFCDVTHTQNFYDMQAMILNSCLTSGDIFILMPYLTDKNFPYSLRLKVIEADQCCNENSSADTQYLQGGIEVDENGRPKHYHFRKVHPGASYSNDNSWITVPAYGEKSGRENVLHLFLKTRPGQRRGMPLLAPVIEKLKQISRLSDAELTAAVVTSFFTVFVKRPNNNTPLFNPGYVPPGGSNNIVTSSTQSVEPDVPKYGLGSGSVVGLNNGEEIEIADPKRPNAAFEPFFYAMVKEIGANIGLPVEVVMMQFNNSYSASKAALQEAWRTFRNDRAWLNRNLTQPVYEAFLTEAITLGRIKAKGFFDDVAIRKAWCGTKWQGSGMGQIQPLQESQSAILRINNNLSTAEDEMALIHDNVDWDTMVNRRAREVKHLEANGLIPAVDTSGKPAVIPPTTTPTQKVAPV